MYRESRSRYALHSVSYCVSSRKIKLNQENRQYMNDYSKIENLSKSIPLRLKIARMARGFKNRSAFALSCNAPVTTYRAHERGDYELKASDIIRYTTGLDISIRWLLTGEGHPLEHISQPNLDSLAQFLYFLRLEDSKDEIKQFVIKEAANLLKKKGKRGKQHSEND